MCANRGYECIRPAHAPNLCVIPVTFIIPGEFWLPPFTSAIIRLYLSGLDSISPSVFQSFSSARHALQAKSLMINDAGTFGWSRTHAYRRLSANLIYQISPSCCWRRMMQLIFERCVWYFSTPRLFAHAHLWQQLEELPWKPWNGVLFWRLVSRFQPVPSKMYLYQGDLLIMNHTDHPRGSKLRKPSYPFRSRCSWWFRPVPSRGKSSAVVGITSTKTACQNSEIRQYTVSWWKGVCMLLSLFARLLKGLPCVSFLEAVVFCRNTKKERQMRK